MSARQKLNLAYFQGCVLLAAALGAATHSWAVFLTALALLAAGRAYGGEIRLRPRRR